MAADCVTGLPFEVTELSKTFPPDTWIVVYGDQVISKGKSELQVAQATVDHFRISKTIPTKQLYLFCVGQAHGSPVVRVGVVKGKRGPNQEMLPAVLHDMSLQYHQTIHFEIDTGASCTCITSTSINMLSLDPMWRVLPDQKVVGVFGSDYCKRYTCFLELDGTMHTIVAIQTDYYLLGRDVIQHYNLVVDENIEITK